MLKWIRAVVFGLFFFGRLGSHRFYGVGILRQPQTQVQLRADESGVVCVAKRVMSDSGLLNTEMSHGG